MLLKPNGSPVKIDVDMTRDQVRMFTQFEEMLERMSLAYQLRCRICNRNDPQADGCWGDNQSNASQYVVECRCTRRIYKGADAPL